MNFFDLHCDTLYRALDENRTLNEPDFHLSVNRGKMFDRWVQAMAIWISDTQRGTAAVETFKNAYKKLQEAAQADGSIVLLNSVTEPPACAGRFTFLFTVENCAALGGDLNNAELFYQCGVKIATLTWNGENELGGGADTQAGITGFGRKVVKCFEEKGILCDVSHASDRLFYDVMEICKKPVLATHSNSRSVTNHRRNITDEQFTAVRNTGGLVGLNFCREFLNEDKLRASMTDIVKHAEHFLALGGEDTLCVGSDFDGTDMPLGISGIESITELYELFLKYYSEDITKKIFFDNAYKLIINDTAAGA